MTGCLQSSPRRLSALAAWATWAAACHPSGSDSGATGWPFRLVAEGAEWSIGAAASQCTEPVAYLLNDEAAWSMTLEELLPVESTRLDPGVVDWEAEDCVIAYTDCSFLGADLSLVSIDGTYGGDIVARYQLDLPQTGQDMISRTYAIHAFAECGSCELTSVVTDR